VFLVRPLPVSFAIKCYSLSSQSRIAVIDDDDDDDDVKYIMCTVNVFFLSFRFSGYEDGADVPDSVAGASVTFVAKVNNRYRCLHRWPHV